MGQDRATGEFQLVPVPNEHVVAVYSFLAALTGPHEGQAAAESTPWPEEDAKERLPRREWSADDLRRFIDGGTQTATTVGSMIDVLAEEPGRYFTTTEIVERIGVSRDRLRGALSALTRHMHKHYRRSNWPFTFRWGPTLGEGHSEEAHYVIAPETASRWVEARSRRSHGQ